MELSSPSVLPIEHRIVVVRGLRVMFDRDLAELYGVPTRTLNQAVRRNAPRFPPDFMFQLTAQELEDWRSHFVISNPAVRMGLRYRPLLFTEHGVAMLSSVLQSQPAIQVNIAIMRAFVRVREWLLTHEDLSRKLGELEQKYDAQFHVVFDAIRELVTPPVDPPSNQIGFRHADSPEATSVNPALPAG
jgi:hypothetical protein